MKYIIIYFVCSVLLTLFSYVYKPFITLSNRKIISSIVFVSYPVIGLLDGINDLSGRYLFLLNVEKKNAALEKKLIRLELQNKLLQHQTCVSSKFQQKKGIFKAQFKFKNNFNIDYIFLHIKKNLDLKKDSCSVFSNNMNLVGIIIKKKKDFYIAKTVFNHSFAADSYIVSDNSTYRALFIGDLYNPHAEFLSPNAKIKAGSFIYTSGAFGVFPKGSLIGRVVRTGNVNNYYKVAYIHVDKKFFNDWNMFVVCIKKR